jgi:hypothetical protein
MKVNVLPALAVASVALIARAQYTPGTGVPTPPPPVVAPTAPAQPGVPTYSWQTPATPAQPAQPAQQAGGLQPMQSDVVRIVAPTPPANMPQFSAQQMADLTASIALYPDPILSEMFPASTYVEQLAYADRWLTQHPGADEASIASLPLDATVKAMMHYPTVLTMMADHLDWTQTMGAAFVYQPSDLMESVQQWRHTAVAYGTLASTPQQDVLQQGNTIMIVPPANQQVVYVPVYDPAVVYVRPVRPIHNAITFTGVGFSLAFVSNDVDWHDHLIHVPVHHDDPHAVIVEHEPKVVFKHDDFKPVVPAKIVTPQPDHKIVTIPPGRGRGGADGNPATPW